MAMTSGFRVDHPAIPPKTRQAATIATISRPLNRARLREAVWAKLDAWLSTVEPKGAEREPTESIAAGPRDEVTSSSRPARPASVIVGAVPTWSTRSEEHTSE